MNKTVDLSIHYENGTAIIYSICSIGYISYGRLSYEYHEDGLHVHHMICTLDEAVQIVKRLGLED